MQDAVLIEFDGSAPDSQRLKAALDEAAALLGAGGETAAFEALTEGRTACYLWDVDLARADPAAMANAAALVAEAAGHPVELTRLEARNHAPGAAAHETPAIHYVVRTNAADGWDEELQRWYDEEHLAGLASVPGNVLARRFIALDHAPRYYACYELLSADVLGSAPWLKVRGTAWSDRIRPQFRDTRRTLFKPAL